MSSGSDARVGVRAGQRERCEQSAKRFASGWSGRAPRPRQRPGAVVVSSNGRPGTRQGSRTPHRGAALPVDAYSLAVACGSRGVSRDIWPASLSAPAVPCAVRLPDTTGTAPRPARHVAPRPGSRHAGRLPRQARSLRASAAPLAVGGTPPSARYHEVGVRCLCDASTAYAALRSEALGQHSMLPSHAGLFVPATSPVATGDCGAP